MEELVNKFSKPGELVTTLLSGTSVTAKACPELSWYRRFVGYRINAECFVESREALVDKYARQVPDEMFDICSSHGVVDACMIAVRMSDKLQVRKRLRSWMVPVALHPVQMFQSHVLHFLLKLFEDPSSFEKRALFALNQLSTPTWEMFHRMKVDMLPAVVCHAIVVALKQ